MQVALHSQGANSYCSGSDSEISTAAGMKRFATCSRHFPLRHSALLLAQVIVKVTLDEIYVIQIVNVVAGTRDRSNRADASEVNLNEFQVN